jgi:hypothetical protein
MIAFANVATANDLEKVMNKGDLAPFKGVLVPEDGYRFYQMDALALEKCKGKLNAGIADCPPCEPEMFSSKQLMFLVSGLLIGFVAARSAQ